MNKPGVARWSAPLSVGYLVLAGLAVPSAGGATLDELKGHSFEVSYTRSMLFADAKRPVEQQWVDRFYVGRAGTIFEYTSHDFGPAGSGSGETAVAADRARSIPWGRMKAWDMQGGNLTKIVQLPEGDVVMTIAVDPGLSRCSFGLQARADPSTRRIVIQTPQGARRDVVSIGLVSYVCTIKPGNIFAADQ